MHAPTVTVVIPTLAADEKLSACLESLEAQTWQDFEIVIVDNSGRRLAIRRVTGRATVIENERNVGFGGAFNQAYRRSSAPLIATLNDDTVAARGWLDALLQAATLRPEAGMFASQVRLFAINKLDSAGMLIAADGSSKQRAHGESPADYSRLEDVLLPSGAAAMYRRSMLERTGAFDEDFFLYCEDTDLGLRGRWAGWSCVYVPDAVVEHHYSHSAGRASALKAYYVERNRLFILVKNFPVRALVLAPGAALLRYFWHLVSMFSGRGAASDFRQGASGVLLVWLAVRAHLSMLANLVRLSKQRRHIRETAVLDPDDFYRVLKAHSITVRQVASL